MIKVSKLKESDVLVYHKLIRRVILNTPYYSKWAREDESSGDTPSWLRKSVRSKNRLVLCAKDKSKVVGFLFGYISAGMFHLLWVGVDPSYRKLRIAEKLVKNLNSGPKAGLTKYG